MRCRRSPDHVNGQINFKSERNRVTALIRSARRNSVKEKLVDARSDSRVTWSVVNELRGEHDAKYSVDEKIAKYFPGSKHSTANSFNVHFEKYVKCLTRSPFSLSDNIEKRLICLSS